MQNKNTTNTVLEAVIIAVLITAIILITGYIPFMTFLASFLLPIPVVIIYMRHDFKIAVSSIVLGIILTSVLYSPIIAFKFGISLSIIGLSLGYTIKNNKKSSTILFYLIVAIIISNIISVAITAMFIDHTSLIGFLNQIAETLSKNFQYSLKNVKDIYIKNGMSSEQLRIIDDIARTLNTEAILSMIPTGFVIIAIVSSYVYYIFVKSILNLLRYKIENVLPFSRFCISNLLGAFLIGAVCIGIILNSKNIAGGKYILTSSQMVAVLLFQLNGIASVIYFFRVKRKSSKGKVILILFITLVVLPIKNMYFIIGLIEMAMDFRKIDPYKIRKI